MTKCNQKELKIASKKCKISFDMEEQSSDGGLLLISKLDEKLGISKKLSHLMEDNRNPFYVKHSLQELFQQRLYGIIQGYEDGNDPNELRDDNLLQMVCGKVDDEKLASQSTICCFENDIYNEMKGARIYNLEEYLMDNFVNNLTSFQRHSITLDIDSTDSQTYGDQQSSLFRSYYNEYMYYPLLVYNYPSGKLAAGMLRPGNAGGCEDAPDLFERLIRKIKNRFPRCRIKVRGDSAFGVPQLLDK